jgi:hypothetical protein
VVENLTITPICNYTNGKIPYSASEGQRDFNFTNKSFLTPFLTLHKKVFEDCITYVRISDNKVNAEKIKEKVDVLRDSSCTHLLNIIIYISH